ncbi:MAG: hypothetical protein WAW02_02930 [Sideroxyarcus sp.]
MSIKLLKTVAVLFMLLALACVAGAFMATNERIKIQGPSALAVLPDRTVWVSVDEALWHLDANGSRLAVVDGATLGVGGRIGNLVVHANGQLVAQVRNDPALYFLDPETALIKFRLLPQWPSDLSEHASNAINYAFHDDGRVAIATGGGHTVAVFDGAGRFLGRTGPGMYKFTNGLWWSGDTLWTTDTNRQQLVELDGNTLTEKSRVDLEKNCGGWQFLGMAVPSRGQPIGDALQRPLATLVRFSNGMVKGHATDVFGDGSQMNFPVVSTPEPRDIKWHGNELLMVDGADYSIKRYSDDHISLEDFGDEQVRAELKGMIGRQTALTNQYNKYLGGAVILFVFGFALAVWAQMREKAGALEKLNVDLSQMGSPMLTNRERFRLYLKVFWPLVVSILFMLLFLKVLKTGLVPKGMMLYAAFLVPLMVLLPLVIIVRQIKERANDAETEAIFNYQPIRFLEKENTFWKVRLPDELPREALMLVSTWGGWNLLVLTTQRLLLFVANLRDRKLSREYALGEISAIRLLESNEMGWLQRWKCFLNPMGGILQIDFRDGTSLSGYVITAQTARRMAERLHSDVQAEFSVSPAKQEHPADMGASGKTGNEKTIRQVIASVLIPGLGQWMQRRSGTALIFFIIWLLQLTMIVPMLLALWKVTTEVSIQTIVMVAATYVLVCAIAAFDTWRMRGIVHE